MRIETSGSLVQDIIIRESYDGLKYGIITVFVNKNNAGLEINKANCFSILINDQEYISTKAELLIKGRQVLIIGDISQLNLFFLKINSIPKAQNSNENYMVISITRWDKIIIVDEMIIRAIQCKTSSYITIHDNTVELTNNHHQQLNNV